MAPASTPSRSAVRIGKAADAVSERCWHRPRRFVRLKTGIAQVAVVSSRDEARIGDLVGEKR